MQHPSVSFTQGDVVETSGQRGWTGGNRRASILPGRVGASSRQRSISGQVSRNNLKYFHHLFAVVMFAFVAAFGARSRILPKHN